MHSEILTLYSAFLLPVLLMYLLVTLRMVERMQTPFEERANVWSILSVRDAALVTLALDVSELSGGLASVLVRESPMQLQIGVAGVLLALHLMTYLLATRRHLFSDESRSKYSTRSILNAYFALTLLMTNAVTLMDIMRAMGKAL